MSKEKKKGGTVENKDKEEVQEEILAESMDDLEVAEEEEKVEEEGGEEKNVLTPEEMKQISEEVDRLTKQVEECRDAMLRTMAETENYKKRLAREKEEAVKYANTSLVKDLIGPLDDFSRALDAAEQSNNFEALKEGVRMIEDRLYTVLKTNWGLEVIEENSVPFNPEEHEACLMEEVEDLKEDTVTMILQKGYRLNGRVIRPAKVKVGRPKS